MTPIWPITTLDGNFERASAAFITEGPKNEEPRPAMVKLMERITITNVLFAVPSMLTGQLPAAGDLPTAATRPAVSRSRRNTATVSSRVNTGAAETIGTTTACTPGDRIETTSNQ